MKTELEITLNKLDKRKLSMIGWKVTKGGDMSRMKKGDIIKAVLPKIESILRDEKIEKVLNPSYFDKNTDELKRYLKGDFTWLGW